MKNNEKEYFCDRMPVHTLVSVLSVPASAEQPPLLPYALELIENLHELAADEVFF